MTIDHDAVRIHPRLSVAVLLFLACGGTAPAVAQGADKRAFTVDDLSRLRDVGDPRISPDGAWVAYTVTSRDLKEDQDDSDIWMVSWDGSTTVRLTSGPESEHSPRWSADGKYLAFLTDRGDSNEADQVWLLNRAGGEAERLTEFRGGVTDLAWSPDSRRLALVVDDLDPADTVSGGSTAKTAHPIVIDRYWFMSDYTGYLGRERQHIYLLDLESRKSERLTLGDYDEAMPIWSPNGRSIAFVSKRAADPDRTFNYDLWAIDAEPGATPRQLTQFEGADNDPYLESPPVWSPDGKSIAYMQGGPVKLFDYGVRKLAILPATGGSPKILAADLDRLVLLPQWTSDGLGLLFLLEDDRAWHLARVPVNNGKVQRLVAGRQVISALSQGPGGRLVVLSSKPNAPAELFAVEGGQLRPLTHENDKLRAEVALAAVEEISFKSKDGTLINGFLVKPPGYRAGTRYPTILRIHGGPVDEFQLEFSEQFQVLAGHGYLVVAANPRGSSGRGEKFASAIYADWGNKDVQDVLAAVDYAVAKGYSDPARLGVGGWSYGGMLTNYTIASDTRFKAATSGAGISNILAGYGTDQYIREYETELGTPWANTEAWLKVSYPFLHADRIVTPTLFLCGQKDMNVPLINSEQMYQALKSLGRETELVIYPGQWHGIDKPSYAKDRLQRYLDWYDRFLK